MITITTEKYLSYGSMYKEGVCLSTDTKPTGDELANGSKLMEMDTSKFYLYDKANKTWREWS